MRIPLIEALSFYSVEPSYDKASFKSVDKPDLKVQLARKVRLDSFKAFAENYLYEINWLQTITTSMSSRHSP